MSIVSSGTQHAVIWTDELLTFLSKPSEEQREAMCAWLERHSIDPRFVPLYGPIERDEEGRAVITAWYDHDERGRKILEPVLLPDLLTEQEDPTRPPRMGSRVKMTERRHQLEAAPAPWPAEITHPKRCGCHASSHEQPR